MHHSHNTLKYLLLAPVIFLAACASIGNPSGGPRDEDPPRFVRANPAPGSLNVNRQRIDIEFDEIVNVKDAFSKVVVSPVSSSTPRVTSIGKRVTVQFPDTLKPNTTYTIDFGNAIEDNNESNKLQGFAYTFSTGDALDTLRISGMVLGSKDLEPQQGILVGAYSNLSDTAFKTLPMERLAKTDDRGRFTIRGLAPGSYRIFALQDMDNDYKYANPEEPVGFLDVTVTPTATREEVTDTIYNLKTGEVDSVANRSRTLYLPNDLLLRTFESGYKAQYLEKYERNDSTRIFLKFGAHADFLPKVSVVGAPDLRDWYTMERNATNDSLIYWLRPKSLVSADTLRLSVNYLRTDSLQQPSPVTDTLRFVTNRPKIKKKKEKKKVNPEDSVVTPPLRLLDVRIVGESSQEVWKPLVIEFGQPLERLDTTAFRLEMKVDTIWQTAPAPVIPLPYDSLNPRRIRIDYPWSYGTTYRISLDSLAAAGIYGLHNGSFNKEITTKKEDDYCSLTFNITNGGDTVAAFVELLNSDNPVRRVKVEKGTAFFPFLSPGKYYARYYEDFNGNGIYDTGDYDSLRQPDLAYYYPKVINLKKNWDKTESWDVFATAIDLMKPEAIKKNKPEAGKRNRRQKDSTTEEEDEEEEYFDPTRNPFDPNDRGRRDRNTGRMR